MKLPTTRYYGSKRKLVECIWSALEGLGIEFDTILDLFGGTGVVSYYMAQKGKKVIYNDVMAFNSEIAKALLCSPKGSFTEKDIQIVLQDNPELCYQHYIRDIFDGIYYTSEENDIIDRATQNILSLPKEKQSSAFYILFQSCIIKRPFNIFHRKNLNLRENHVKSRFGNKTTWEKSFETLFVKFTKELNEIQFAELPHVYVRNSAALELKEHADLVYIDTPYFSSKSSDISYHSRYHFLEGLVDYNNIPNAIDFHKSNHEITLGQNSEFVKKSTFLQELDLLLGIHENSIIVLSYTNNGYPTIEELKNLVARHKENVKVVDLGHHSFALNRNNMQRSEILIIGT